MAKTFIGQLILRLQAQGLNEAKRVEGAVSQIERAARRLSAAPWGANFQRQLDKLGASTQQIHAVRQSWTRLHEDMNRRGLSDAMKKSDIAAWKMATLGHFSAVRSDMATTERRAKQFSRNLQTALRPAMVMMGAYTGVYFGGMMMREAASASSERRREIFRQRMANISEDDQTTLLNKAEDLGDKYPSIAVTDIMEMSRYAWSLMGDADRGADVLEKMVQSLVTLQSVKGVEASIHHLTGLLRGFDNLGVNKDGQRGVDLVNELIDAATKAAQVDPDFDPAGLFSFAKRSKVAGPALSAEFLARAPAYIQDTGSDTAGNQLAMAFKAFVLEAVGSAGGKKYLEERDRLGIRKGGKLVGEDQFTTDPDQWVLEVLAPALERDGIDLADEGAITKAVGRLSGNTNATGFMTRVLTQREQVARILRQFENAVGTDIAEDVRHNDPFVAWEAFKKSLENLSSEVLPIDSIASGLNSLADTINRFKNAVKEGDPRVVNTALGAGALAAAWGTWKITSGIWGLITAGAALNTAAVSLQAAAVSLGAAGAAGGAGDAVGGAGKTAAAGGAVAAIVKWFRRLGVAAAPGLAATALSDTPGDTFEEQVENQRKYREALEWIFGIRHRSADEKFADEAARNKQAETDREQSLDSFLDGPPKPMASEADIYRRAIEQLPGEGSSPAAREADDASMRALHMSIESGEMEAVLEGVKALAANAGQSVTESLSVSARPNVDTGAVDALIERLRTAISLFGTLGTAAASAQSNADAELRRTFSDYGVAP